MGQSSRVSRLVRRVVAVDSSRAHLGPLLRRLIVTFFILQQLLRDAPDERIVRIRIRQQRADGEQDLGDGERGRPLLLQDVQANLPRTVDVAVIDSRSKRNFRRFERVIRWKLNVKKKYTILIGRSCARCRDGTPSDRSAFDSNGEGRARVSASSSSPLTHRSDRRWSTPIRTNYPPSVPRCNSSAVPAKSPPTPSGCVSRCSTANSSSRSSARASPRLLPSFLPSFVRWRPSRSPRVARLVSSRLVSRLDSSRLDSVVVSARRTLTSRRRRRDDDSLKSSSSSSFERRRDETKTQSVERGGGAGVNPTFVCVSD